MVELFKNIFAAPDVIDKDIILELYFFVIIVIFFLIYSILFGYKLNKKKHLLSDLNFSSFDIITKRFAITQLILSIILRHQFLVNRTQATTFMEPEAIISMFQLLLTLSRMVILYLLIFIIGYLIKKILRMIIKSSKAT